MSQDIKELISLIKKPSPSDIELIEKAFNFAQKAHEGQTRASGEPYIIHPLETAKTLATLQLETKVIAAGLLHDTCEDNEEISEKDIKREFGEEIAQMVSGVTKLGKIKYRGIERQIENLRKIFLAMAKDIRVVLIRLADRLHNMKTLDALPEEKRKRIAIETLEIYAPIANRLGMGKIKGDLEDLSFKYVYPEDYKKVKDIFDEKLEQRKTALAKIRFEIEKDLSNEGLKNFQIDSRIKHLYSLYKKLLRPEYDMNINKVYDLIAVRIVVDNIEDCYKALGIIHKKWKPLPEKIKDYIAVPKPNGYQSLHTSVFADKGNITEIQIRTHKMHEEAEYGITAHWAYAEAGKPKKGVKVNPRLTWVNQLVEWQKNNAKSGEFLETLRVDFFRDRVFCFTPEGDVIDLPEGATAIDFAYAVHSDIGNSAGGAIVNHKFVSLGTLLKNGDIVEIVTQKNKKPSREMARVAKTSLAKKHIKKNSK